MQGWQILIASHLLSPSLACTSRSVTFSLRTCLSIGVAWFRSSEGTARFLRVCRSIAGACRCSPPPDGTLCCLGLSRNKCMWVVPQSCVYMRDLAFAAHEDPIDMWAEAAWCSWLPRADLQSLAAQALQLVLGTKAPWSRVTGPATASVASARRLGWVGLSLTRY